MNFLAVKRLFREDILPYLKSGTKKSYARQIREVAELYRTHRSFPYQYIKTEIYTTSFEDPVRDYVPPRLVYSYMETINAREDLRLAKDKVEFRRLLAAAGLPVIRELFHVDRNGSIFDADLAPIDADRAFGIAQAHGDDIFVKPVDGTWGLGTFILPPAELSRDLIAGWRQRGGAARPAPARDVESDLSPRDQHGADRHAAHRRRGRSTTPPCCGSASAARWWTTAPRAD